MIEDVSVAAEEWLENFPENKLWSAGRSCVNFEVDADGRGLLLTLPKDGGA